MADPSLSIEVGMFGAHANGLVSVVVLAVLIVFVGLLLARYYKVL
jgi:hypothetical protein